MGRARSRRRRGKSGGVGSSRSKSKSNKSKSKSTGGSRGRSNNTRGGQHKANKNQNKKARRTVKSVKKAVSKVAKNVGKTVRNATRGLAAKAGTHIANSQYNKQLKQANWTKRDMSKLTPQQQRKYQRLSEKTGRDYSMRKPTFRLNLNADTLARFGGFADKGWYKGITSRFPGIKKLKINKQFYGNPVKKGWHSSQRTGRGQGIKQLPRQLGGQDYETQTALRQAAESGSTRLLPLGETLQRPQMGPQQDWLGDLYSSHNISGGKLDQGARDYWTNEAKTKGRDAVMQSIIGTSKAQGTYGGRKKPQRINRRYGFGTPRVHRDNKGSRRKRKDYGYSPWAAAAISTGRGLIGGVKAAKSAKRKQDLQNEGAKRRQGMLAKTLAATMAARGT